MTPRQKAEELRYKIKAARQEIASIIRSNQSVAELDDYLEFILVEAENMGWNDRGEADIAEAENSCRCGNAHENECVIFDVVNKIFALKRGRGE